MKFSVLPALIEAFPPAEAVVEECRGFCHVIGITYRQNHNPVAGNSGGARGPPNGLKGA